MPRPFLSALAALAALAPFSALASPPGEPAPLPPALPASGSPPASSAPSAPPLPPPAPPGYSQQAPPPGYYPQGSPPPPPGYYPQGYPPPGYYPQGYPPPPGYYPQGAPPAAPPPPLAPREESRWYGWQTLIPDGAAFTFMVLGTSASRGSGTREAELWMSAALVSVGAPVVHFAHGNPGRGVGSLAMRNGLGLLYLMLARDCSTCSVDRKEGYAVLLMLSALWSIPIDAAALAREKVVVEPASAISSLRISPTLTPGRAGLGLSGEF